MKTNCKKSLIKNTRRMSHFINVKINLFDFDDKYVSYY